MSGIKEDVVQLVKKHQSNNPFELAEMCNIIVLYEPLGKTLGYYNVHKRVQMIHINQDIDEILQRFVCAHELGHAILHPKANTPFLKRHTFFSVDKIEVEANTFAVELLMLDEKIREFKNTNLSIEEIAQICGVPRGLSYLKNFTNIL
jgi:Zn-dependent peptidase ImmA (M78 family)